MPPVEFNAAIPGKTAENAFNVEGRIKAQKSKRGCQ